MDSCRAGCTCGRQSVAAAAAAGHQSCAMTTPATHRELLSWKKTISERQLACVWREHALRAQLATF